MQYKYTLLPMAMLFAAATGVATADRGVYSAAGELPGQRMERLANEHALADASRIAQQAMREAEQARKAMRGMAPPLPQQASNQPPLPATTAPSNTTAGAAQPPPLPQPQPQSQSQSQPQQAATPPPMPTAPTVERDFDGLMASKVAIDVVDMEMQDVLEKLAPAGWRVRFQRIDDATLKQRIDLTTTTATRGEVFHELLARAGLALEEFPAFDQPLLLVSQQ